MSRHGTHAAYNADGCRCQVCRTFVAAYHREWKARRRIVPLHVRHGTNSTYTNYDCRCQPCSEAHSAYLAVYKQQRADLAAYKQRRQEATR